METIINLGIPHVGELIFESIDTPGLLECALVSETWKVLAENVLLEASKNGETKIVQLLLDNKSDVFHSDGQNLCGLAITDIQMLSSCFWNIPMDTLS